MDTTWAFRQAYDKARSIKHAQDAFCDAFFDARGDLESPYPEGDFPEDLQWEALVDILRGKVKVCIDLTVYGFWQLTIFSGPNSLLHRSRS